VYTRGGKNVLFVENALLKQGSGVFVDAGGYFADSTIVRDREHETEPTHAELMQLAHHLQTHFGWTPNSAYTEGGPILIALQTPNDAPVRYHYPARRNGEDQCARTLEICAAHLPNGDVIVRPHPADRKRFSAHWNRYRGYMRAGWIVDETRDVYALLPRCGAVVTVNSTLATEALALRMPVATLGESTFSGSSVTFECARCVERLQDILCWRPDAHMITHYLCAVMRHQLNISADVETCLINKSIRAWIERANPRISMREHVDAHYADVVTWAQSNGSSALVALIDATQAKLQDCKTCDRRRLQQRVIEAARAQRQRAKA